MPLVDLHVKRTWHSPHEMQKFIYIAFGGLSTNPVLINNPFKNYCYENSNLDRRLVLTNNMSVLITCGERSTGGQYIYKWSAKISIFITTIYFKGVIN